MRKNFEYGEGIYYFNIKNWGTNYITIKRHDRREAVLSYLNYKRMGKTCDWLGKWSGKKFVETSMPTMDKVEV